MTKWTVAGVCCGLVLTGCTVVQSADDDEGSGGAAAVPPPGIPVLGRYAHVPTSVQFMPIASAIDQLNVVRDLAFHPLNPSELWVVNRGDNSAVIVTNPGQPEQTSKWANGIESQHFLAQPSSLAMSPTGFFATCHETDDLTQGNITPIDFMGPTLWTSDSDEFNGDVFSHYDMLHNSPNCMGIAWQRDNVYWVFDGFHSSITMYDFRVDHGPAGTDHTDGIVKRYVEGAVLWLENVPSHMQFDPPGSNLLYIADTGHSRIALLDTATGVQGAPVPPNYDGTDQSRVDNAIITTFIDGLALDPVMATPSGLAIHDGHMFVTDNATSTIFAFDMQANLVDWLHTDLAPGSLMGITFDALGQLYVADALANQVVRITALPEEVLEEDAP